MADFAMLVDTAVKVPVNLLPLLDDTDFKSIEDAVAYNAAGMDLRWNFATPAGVMTSTAVTPTTGGDYDWTHKGDGIYEIEIPASSGASINNDTEGFGWFSGKATGVLPFRGPVILFAPANVINSLILGTDKLDINVAEWKGSAAPDNTGDAYARLGAPAGESIAADIVTVDTVVDAIKAKTDNLPASPATEAKQDTIIGYVDCLPATWVVPAAAGAAMTLTAQERIDLSAAIEAAIINDLDGTAVMQAIADLIASDMTTTDLTVAAIAAACRDAILNRVLNGNHDTAGTPGKLLQNCDAPVSDVPTVAEFEARTIAAADYFVVGDYTAPDNATIGSISSGLTTHRTNTEVTLSKLHDMIQLDEASSPQFTANALEQVPKSGYSLATAPPTAAEIKTALEADGGKLDHVWETTEDNAGVRRFSAAALAESPTAAGAFTDEDRAALAAAKAVTDAIATMIVIDGAVYQFTENALELGPAGGGVSFGSIAFALQSTVGAGQVADGSITLYQNAAIAGIVIVVTDEDGNPVDLLAATLVFVVYKDPATVLWSLTEAAGQLTVGGAGNNQVTLAADDTNTATAGHYRYALWDTAADLVRARGVLTIEREASAPQG